MVHFPGGMTPIRNTWKGRPLPGNSTLYAQKQEPGRGPGSIAKLFWSDSGGDSDAHGHEHITVLVLGFGVLWAHLAGGLRILELEPDLAFVVQRFQEVNDVGRVEAHHDGVTGVGCVDGVFALAGLGGVGADPELVAFKAQADGAGTLVG